MSTTDDTWDPPQGRLFFREHVEMDHLDLGFVDEPRAPGASSCHTQSIATHRAGESCTNFGGNTDSARGHESKTELGDTIRRRLATDSELRAFLAAWVTERRDTPQEWAEQLDRSQERGLDPEEVVRIRTLVAELGGGAAGAWTWPLPGVPVPSERVAGHPGAFGAVRRYDVHTGVDLYCDEGQQVTAVEPGIVVAVEVFTGPSVGSPWWHETQAVLVEGVSGVVLYGELEPAVRVGDRVAAGATVGHVDRVLKKDKGLPTTMLHLELYAAGARSSTWWKLGEACPEGLRDPTSQILNCNARRDG